MIPVLLIFLVFTWGISFFDPTIKDDMTIELKDDGLNCDKAAGDMTYSGCFELVNSETGIWNIHAKMVSQDNPLMENSTYFYYANNASSKINHKANGAGILDILLGKKPPSFSVYTEKQQYAKGEMLAIFGV